MTIAWIFLVLFIVIIGGVLFLRIRSGILERKLLDVAARREKHAPKAAEVPTHFTSDGSKIQEYKVTQQETQVEHNRSASSVESKESTVLESPSRQVDELTTKERANYDARDQARDDNIIALRLLVDDLFEATEGISGEIPTDSKQEQSSVELRNTWIQHYEEPLNEHAAFIEQEEIGSGIRMMETTEIGNDDIQDRIEREGGKTGEVQISLAWDDFNDLDLHLFCPSGERIYFNNKKSACGGELDVDMNVRPTSEKAVENIVWPDSAPLGQYKVGVHFYKHHSRDDTTTVCKFRARITTYGKVRDYSGSITHGQAMQMVTSFTLNR
jgi:hypothetical protein